MAESEGKLVVFKADVFPYCKNDVVRLSKEEQQRVDEAAAAREIGTPYAAYVEAEVVASKTSK